MIRKNFKKLIAYIVTLIFCCNFFGCLYTSGFEQILDPNMDEYEPFDSKEQEELEEELESLEKDVETYLDQQEKEKRLEFEKASNNSVWVHQYIRNVYDQAYTLQELLKKLNQINPNFAEEYIGYRTSVGKIRNLYERILELLPDQSHPEFLYFFAALNMLEQISLEGQFNLTLETKPSVEFKGDVAFDFYYYVNVLPYQRFLIIENKATFLDFFWLWYYICCKLNYHISDEPAFDRSDCHYINRNHIRCMYDLSREMLEENVLSPGNIIYAQLAKNMAEQIAIENNFALCVN